MFYLQTEILMLFFIWEGDILNILNTRFKNIREKLHLNQKSLGNELGLSNSGISNIEKGIRSVTDKHIKLLSAIFNVNETWLRTGIGEMFIEPDSSAIEQLTKDYNLDKFDQQLLLTYLELQKSDRDILKKYILNLSAKTSASKSNIN